VTASEAGRAAGEAVARATAPKRPDVWVFADFKIPSAADLRTIEATRCTDVVLGVANADKPFRLKGKRADWLRAMASLDGMGVRSHVMPWARRDESFIRAMMAQCLDLADEGGASSILLDAEYHWIHGRMDATDAAVLARQLAGDIRLGVTGYTKVQESLDPLLDVCDYGCPQAYAFWRPGGEHWSHGAGSEPGAPQRRAIREWGHKPMVVALAAYWLARPARRGLPPMTQREAWDVSLAAALEADPMGIGVWSLKWLHKWTGHQERLALVRALSGP
jgi:hypothetical protein